MAGGMTFAHSVLDPMRPPPNTTSGSTSPRGFSLLEVMVVVVIVGALVTMAIPSISAQLRDRRTNQAANEIALVFRTARARALGRGGAVLVRFNAAGGSLPIASVEMREAVSGSASTTLCETAPVTSCSSTAWDDSSATPPWRRVSQFDPNLLSGVYAGLDVALYSATGSAIGSTSDVCFSPLGRAYFRTGTGSTPFGPLTSVPYVDVKRSDGVGLVRRVLFVPTGGARILAVTP